MQKLIRNKKAAPVQSRPRSATPRSAASGSLADLQAVADSSAPVRRLRGVVQAAKAGIPVQLEEYSEDDIELIKKMQARVRAIREMRRVQEQVRVQSEGAGITGTRIRRAPEGGSAVAPEGSPLHQIQQNLDQASEYNSLHIHGGARKGGVRGPSRGEGPKPAAELASGLPAGTAIINGGFFAHTPKMRSEENWPGPEALSPQIEDPAVAAYYKADEVQPVGPEGVGRPVGPTSTRDDHLPIPSEYRDYYGQVTIGGEVGLSSGPLLSLGGEQTALPDPQQDDRFRYRIQQDEGSLEENPRNSQVGVMTHAGDRNARAAISVAGYDTYFQTVTSPTANLGEGVTMPEWQNITAAGAGISPNRPNPDGSTLNLDGGGSVFMGITGQESGNVRVIAKGSRPNEKEQREVGNIIASAPDTSSRTGEDKREKR